MNFGTLLIISWKTEGAGIAKQVIPTEVRAAAEEVMAFLLAVDSRDLVSHTCWEKLLLRLKRHRKIHRLLRLLIIIMIHSVSKIQMIG